MINIKKPILLTASSLAFALVFAATAFQNSQLQAQEVESNTTIEEINEAENLPLGEEVSVRGKVAEIEPEISFVLEQDGILADEKVLVINVAGATLPVSSDDDLRLQVTGEMATLTIANIERDYGLELDPELYVEYETQPVILAESMVLAPELEEVTENPEFFYSQEIALEGEVDEIKSDYTFTLTEDKLIEKSDLLIINASGDPIPTEDEKVVVTGTVRPYIKAEFERDYDLTWDLDVQEQLEAEYTEKPVLVIDDIYPSAEETSLLDRL